MASMIGPHERFPGAEQAVALLDLWRQQGPAAVRQGLEALNPLERQRCALLQELWSRLEQQPGPRLLVDGIWWSQTHGGISRVWQQIRRCWDLPGLVHSSAPVRCIPPRGIDPLDWSALAESADHNRRETETWRADVFLSSWITSTGGSHGQPACPELALVHDCIPERVQGVTSDQRRLRTRWLLGARRHLAMSAATAGDLAQALGQPDSALSWCHPCTAHLFSAQAGDGDAGPDFRRQLGLPESYVLLPASSAIGSYKNPELVLEALVLPALQRHHLLLTGVAAQTQAQRYREAYPALADRIHVRAVEDSDLRLLYRHALAVVVPSRVEGFGLPVLEALAAEGTVLSTDVPGLREAGSGAVPLLDPEQPRQLAAWLELLAEPHSRTWFEHRLGHRRQQRLADVSPDLVGLVLLALVRDLKSDAGLSR